MPTFVPRLHVLLASQARVGLVIRRGPSKAVATLLWDRRQDEFKLGQWLRGRIYERRCDLSPDGRHFLYFAMNGRWESPSRGSWTAISRVPYLKAVAFFTKGDCWNGGGLWTSNTTYWLNEGFHSPHTIQLKASGLRQDPDGQPAVNYGGECPDVYYHRLQRDGWLLTKSQKIGPWHSLVVFEKKIRYGWTLRKISHSDVNAPAGKGCYWDEHVLVDPAGKVAMECSDWEWADLDGKRLVWASQGKLHAAFLRREGLDESVERHDFNGMAFEAITAPY